MTPRQPIFVALTTSCEESKYFGKDSNGSGICLWPEANEVNVVQQSFLAHYVFGGQAKNFGNTQKELQLPGAKNLVRQDGHVVIEAVSNLSLFDTGVLRLNFVRCLAPR